jgi:hypothetical protein
MGLIKIAEATGNPEKCLELYTGFQQKWPEMHPVKTAKNIAELESKLGKKAGD